jgi:tetratricopeptide (TPR) repeat protein
MAGAGKTELALQAAHAAIEKGWFPGGVLFIDLFGYDAKRKVDPSAALDGMLRAAGIPGEHIPGELQDRSRLFSSVMTAYADSGREVLVIIDNGSSSAQARPLLPGRGKAVITSRYTLASLDAARLLTLDVLDAEASADLLTRQLHVACGAADSRTIDDPLSALSIGRLCGGLPLALRIVSAILAANPSRLLSAFAADLKDTRSRLDELCYGDGDDQLAVRAAFELSYECLNPRLKQVFRLLTVNPGPDVSTPAVAVITALSERTVRKTLDELARAHLIDPGSIDGRWRMHDLIRIYADQLGQAAAEQDGRAQAFTRLLGGYLATASAACHQLNPAVPGPADYGPPDSEEALAWLDGEYRNMAAAVPLAADSDDEVNVKVARELPLVLSTFFTWRPYSTERIILTEHALRAARRLGGDRNLEAQALGNLATALREAGRTGEARAAHETAAQIFREIGDLNGLGIELLGLGNIQLEAGRPENAIALFREARQIFIDTGNRLREGGALNALAGALTAARRPDEAITSAQESRDICIEAGDKAGQGQALSNLGNAFVASGKMNEAVAAFSDAAAVHRGHGYQYGLSEALNNLALALQQSGHDEQAIMACRENRQLYINLEDQHGEARALILLGGCQHRAGLAEEAFAAYEEARQICCDIGDKTGEAQALCGLGTVLCDLGQLSQAARALSAAAEIDRESGNHQGEAVTLTNLAEVLAHARLPEQAAETLLHAAQIFHDIGNQHHKASTLTNLGPVLLQAGRHEEAASTCGEAAKIFEKIGDQQGRATALHNLGAAFMRLEQFQEATSAFAQAARIYHQLGNEPLETLALTHLERAQEAERAAGE